MGVPRDARAQVTGATASVAPQKSNITMESLHLIRVEDRDPHRRRRGSTDH
eukprot:COSAG06_NODE_904_length_11632_cov_58.250325_5_plen_51_part_00